MHENAKPLHKKHALNVNVSGAVNNYCRCEQFLYSYLLDPQCISYLMAMSTDTDQSVKAKADKQLSEHTSRYGHLMQVTSLQLVLQSC